MFSGKNLRIMRAYNRMSQKELADKLHISPASVSDYERGKRCPNARTLRQMCLLFQCSSAVFLDEDAELPDRELYEAVRWLHARKPEAYRVLLEMIHSLTQPEDT